MSPVESLNNRVHFRNQIETKKMIHEKCFPIIKKTSGE